jgi:hypothetical protein
MRPHLLILGGTTDARALAERLAPRGDLAVTLSLAGRTLSPAALPVPVRVGGFGGAEGLAAYLREHRIAALLDLQLGIDLTATGYDNIRLRGRIAGLSAKEVEARMDEIEALLAESLDEGAIDFYPQEYEIVISLLEGINVNWNGAG